MFVSLVGRRKGRRSRRSRRRRAGKEGKKDEKAMDAWMWIWKGCEDGVFELIDRC